VASRPEEGAEAEVNWGKVYTQLLAHLNLGGYDSIKERSILQLHALMENLPEEIRLKIGLPSLFGGAAPSGEQSEVLNQSRDISVSDLDDICSMFAGF
jgi:hypothetical protein